jgi:hypothetical protein
LEETDSKDEDVSFETFLEWFAFVREVQKLFRGQETELESFSGHQIVG